MLYAVNKYRIRLPILLPLSKLLLIAVVDNDMRVAMKSFGSDSYFWCEVIFPNKIFRAVIPTSLDFEG